MQEKLTDEEHEVLEKVADKARKKKLVLPAVIFLESNMVGMAKKDEGLKPPPAPEPEKPEATS